MKREVPQQSGRRALQHCPLFFVFYRVNPMIGSLRWLVLQFRHRGFFRVLGAGSCHCGFSVNVELDT
jgi:hypothetical protein